MNTVIKKKAPGKRLCFLAPLSALCACALCLAFGFGAKNVVSSAEPLPAAGDTPLSDAEISALHDGCFGADADHGGAIPLTGTETTLGSAAAEEPLRYYLAADTQLTKSIAVSGAVDLCLHGYALTYTNAQAANAALIVSANSTLRLFDCRSEAGADNVHTIPDPTSNAANQTVTITGGLVTSPDAQASRSLIQVDSSATLELYGGTIAGTNISQTGGGIKVSGVLKMYGGAVSYNQSASVGGGIYGGSGTSMIHILGGSVSHNRATQGGGIYSHGPVTVEAGEIAENQASSGGGIYKESSGLLTLSGGVVSGNSAGSLGGGIRLSGTSVFHFTGGTVVGNVLTDTNSDGAGIYLSNDCSVSGSAVVRDNYLGSAAGNGVPSNLFSHRSKITVGAFADAEIGVSFDNAALKAGFTTGYSVNEAQAWEYFFSDDPACFIALNADGEAALASELRAQLAEDAAVYTSTPLDSLKAKLQVDAKIYGGNTYSGVEKYALSLPEAQQGAFVAGENVVTVTYGRGTTAVTVSAEKLALQSIAVTAPPAKTAYKAFERLAAEGMVVTARYNDVAQDKAVTGYLVKYTGDNDSFRVGDTSVTISYTEDLITKEATAENLTVSKLALKKPSLTGEYTYTGAAQTAALSGFDGERMKAENNTRTGAGTQTVSVSLLDGDNCEWEGGGAAAVELVWTIAKADYDLSGVSFGNASVTADGKTHTLTIEGTLPDGVTVSYAGTNGYTAEGVSAAGVYEVTAAFAVADEANYNVPAAKKATLTIAAAVVPPATTGTPGLGSGAIAGIVIGCVFAAAALALLALFLFRKDKSVGFKVYYAALFGGWAAAVKGWFKKETADENGGETAVASAGEEEALASEETAEDGKEEAAEKETGPKDDRS